MNSTGENGIILAACALARYDAAIRRLQDRPGPEAAAVLDWHARAVDAAIDLALAPPDQAAVRSALRTLLTSEPRPDTLHR